MVFESRRLARGIPCENEDIDNRLKIAIEF